MRKFLKNTLLTIAMLGFLACGLIYGLYPQRIHNALGIEPKQWEYSELEESLVHLRFLHMFLRYNKQPPVLLTPADHEVLSKMSRVEQIYAVNSGVNKIPYELDEDVYGVMEWFATPYEFFTSGRGDCEDYAIAKYYFFLQLGFEPTDMYLVTGVYTDPNTGEQGGHAQLVLKHQDEFYVLDNGTDKIWKVSDWTTMQYLFGVNHFTQWSANESKEIK